MGGCATKEKTTNEFVQDDSNYQKNAFVSEENASCDVILLYFKCTSVKKLGIAAEPTTKIVVKESKGGDDYAVVGETEIIEEDNNPKFSRSVQASYNIQGTQEFRIELYEATLGQNSEYLPEKSCLGSADFIMHELIKANDKCLTIALKEKKRKSTGVVCVSYERVISSKKVNTISISAEISPFHKPDINFYYKIYRDIVPPKRRLLETVTEECKEIPKLEDLQLVYDSKYGGIKTNDVIYVWRPLKMTYSNFCLEDPNLQLVLEVGCKKDSEQPEEVKETNQTILCKMFSLSNLQQSELWLPLNVNDEQYGIFKLYNPIIAEEGSFLDYVNKGINLKLCIGLDWTVSNNLPTGECTYHNMDLNLNPYCLIMSSLGKAILCFDSFQSIPVLAFGGSIPDIGRSSCFALNGKIFEPEVLGMISVIELYVLALKKVKLGGPSYFSEVLKYYADYITEYMNISFEDCPRYFIILIITDGSPLDYEETLTELVRLSSLPTSVIFIGINPTLCQPFQQVLEKPDLLYSEFLKRSAERNAIIFYSYEHDPKKLLSMAKNVFSVIQKQFVEYMTMHNIEPKDSTLSKGKTIETSLPNKENQTSKAGTDEMYLQKLDPSDSNLLRSKNSGEQPIKSEHEQKESKSGEQQIKCEFKEKLKGMDGSPSKNEEKPNVPINQNVKEAKIEIPPQSSNHHEENPGKEAESLKFKCPETPTNKGVESPLKEVESPLKTPNGVEKDENQYKLKLDQLKSNNGKKDDVMKAGSGNITPQTMIAKDEPAGKNGPKLEDIPKEALDASSIPYVMMLNKFKRTTIKRRTQFKKETERIDAHEEGKDLKKEDEKKILTVEEQKEEERRQRNDFERIEELISIGFPVRDPQVIIETIRNKDFKNHLLVDPTMKHLIIQTQN